METKITDARWALCEFNLKVAKFRCKVGMNQGLINLYAMMGRLDNALKENAELAKSIESTFNNMSK